MSAQVPPVRPVPPAPDGEPVLDRLAEVIASRRAADPDLSYVARLLARAPDAVLAAKDGDRTRIVAETADLWFHCLVMLEQYGLHPQAVLDELARREGLSGLEEKAARKAIARETDERPQPAGPPTECTP